MNTLNTVTVSKFSKEEVHGLLHDYDFPLGVISDTGCLISLGKPTKNQISTKNALMDLDQRGYTITHLSNRQILLGKKYTRNLQESEVRKLQEVGRARGLLIACNAGGEDYWSARSGEKSYSPQEVYNTLVQNGFCPVIRQTTTEGVRNHREVVVKMLEGRK